LTFVQFTVKNNSKYRQIPKNVQNTKTKKIKTEQRFSIKTKNPKKTNQSTKKNCGQKKSIFL
jgi:hypothetical protein